jgi:hypothetical protein
MSGKTKSVYTPYTQIGRTDRLDFVTSVRHHPLAILRFRVRSICLGIASEWSQTVTIRTQSNFTKTIQTELRCERPFEDGVFHWIGTSGRKQTYDNPQATRGVKVSLSCKWYPADSAMYTEHHPKSLIYNNDLPCSWIDVDLGEGRMLVPSQYCLRGFENMRIILRSWELQAKREEASGWITLKSHHNDMKLIPSGSQSSCPIGLWNIDGVTDCYRFFRILQLDQSSKGMKCSGIELYGTLIEKVLSQIPLFESPLKKSNQLSSF